MKILNKISSVIFAALFAAGITSCSTESYDCAEPVASGTPSVYFPSAQNANVSLPLTESEFNVELSRADASDELTVNLRKVDDLNNVFDVPATATFAKGSNTTTVKVTIRNAKPFVDYRLGLALDPDVVNPYVVNQNGTINYVAHVQKEDWKFYSKCTVLSAWYEKDFETEMQYSETLKQYRVYNVWDTGVHISFSIDEKSNVKFAETKYSTKIKNDSGAALSWAPDYTVNEKEGVVGCVFDAEKKVFTFTGEWSFSGGSYGSYPGTVTLHD